MCYYEVAKKQQHEKEAIKMTRKPYLYAKLSGKIVEKYATMKAFAKAVGICENSMSSKLRGIYPWKPVEIEKICKLLDISDNEIKIYFFTS